jgi:3-methyladenine DNA glycosylase AlkD
MAAQQARLRARARAAASASPTPSVAAVVAELKGLGSESVRAGMARYAIPADAAFGIPVGVIRQLGKRLGPSHELAQALWSTGFYEARLLAAFVAEPERLTPAQMDRWCRDFDNWAVCDTACFHLFDRSPHAFAKVAAWAKRRDEFVRRAAFALLASLALHDRQGPDAPFARCLPLIERAADDERNFVKKAVSWALKGVGGRSRELHAEALELARRLAQSAAPSSRWVGKDVLRDLNKPAALRRLTQRSGPRRAAAAR